MSAIYKEGYWYPADSLNTLKAVTMSNADYEALTPQKKEELGGIEIFIPDRPLTGGGTGAVIIYNGVEYAGTPTSRLENLEAIVGDGQQTVGSDLTDAVTQLNSSLTNKANKILTYIGHETTNTYGNLNIPSDIVTPSTGVVLAVSTDGNYKAIILGQTTQNIWSLRFYNYATTNMNSVANIEIWYRIFYILF